MSSINSVEPGIHGSMRRGEAIPCIPSGIINDQYSHQGSTNTKPISNWILHYLTHIWNDKSFTWNKTVETTFTYFMIAK